MNTRHIPHVAAELPPGWSSVEAAELFGPGGLQIRITSQPVVPEMSTSELAERHGAMLADQVTGFRDLGLEDAMAFSGHQVLRRRTSYGGDMGLSRGLVSYLVLAGSAYVASATGPSEEFAAREAEVIAIIEDLLIMGRPLAAPATGNEPESGDGPVESAPGTPRPPLPSSAWDQVRSAWATRTEPTDPVPPELVLSGEELLVVASVVGCGTFPGVDPMILGTLTRKEREVTTSAVARSLLTRNVLVEADGRLEVADAWRSLVDVALYPDLHVEVAVSAAGTMELFVLCARPDALVQTRPAGAFGYRVACGAPEDLVQLIIDRSGLATAAAGQGAEQALAIDNLARTVRLRTTWRDGSALVGGELRWVVDAEGRLGAVDETPEPGTTSVVVRPTDLAGAREAILGHLPGG